MSDSIVKTRCVGLDVHKREITYCILAADGATIAQGKFALDRKALRHFAKNTLHAGDQVALESTTNCWAVADVVRPHVGRVVVSNPMATKAIAQSKIKTDKVDARVLAQLLRCDFLPEVWQPDVETRLRRQLSGRRASLVGQRTQLRNRIHSVLAMRLIIPPIAASSGLFSKLGRTWLDNLTEKTIDADGLDMIASDLRLLDALAVEIENHNIAVVATARKMAMITWRMLRYNEPYRYSPPRSTETKLARMRVSVTGQRRKSGSPKGQKAVAKLPGGSRTIKSLDVICSQEGLPPRTSIRPGEAKHLAASETQQFVRQIAQSQTVPRKPTQPAKQKGKQKP